MNIINSVNYTAEQIVYWTTSLTSAIVCIVFGVLLIIIRRSLFNRQSPFYPARYIMARRMLGTAYSIIGTMMLFQLATTEAVVAPKQSEFLPISGLVISTSQALLFTAALLALYNSRLVTREIMLWSILPVVLYAIAYALCRQSEPALANAFKWLIFGYYMLQLVGYTVVFFIERKRYKLHIEEYFDDWGYNAYRNLGVTVLFLCSLAVGIAALASYFFTELWHLIIFIATYTIYYAAVAIYFLNYRRKSQKIVDMTTPENWNHPEKVKYRNEI